MKKLTSEYSFVQNLNMKLTGARCGALFIFIALVVLGIFFQKGGHPALSTAFSSIAVAAKPVGLTKDNISDALGSSVGNFVQLPTEMNMPVNGESQKTIVQYAFDAKLQEDMQELFKSYKPDYGAFVAIDATTGRVLSMISYNHGDKTRPDHLALRATFPSASVFKMVTAAAVISEKKFSADTRISYNGANHTLYHSQILKSNVNRWTHQITLREAFAKSVNTVFGRIGAYNVGAVNMADYAGRFGFNRKIAADIPIQQGKSIITNDPWSLAETASGYTRENTMSPMQGAIMAAAIANDGNMMEPYVVQSIHSLDGTPIYNAEPKLANTTVSSETAAQIRALMRETVVRGTSKKSFRGFFKGGFSFIDVGGKTGSLLGTDPKGKYDWFVGYAHAGTHRIAICALTVHEKLWRVKSSYLARRAIESYFKPRLAERNVASVSRQTRNANY